MGRSKNKYCAVLNTGGVVGLITRVYVIVVRFRLLLSEVVEWSVDGDCGP